MNESQQPRNLKTEQAHRKESFRQIWLPLALGILMVAGLFGWAIVVAVQGGNVNQAADASLIFVIIPTMIMALIPLAILGGFVYLMTRVLNILPPKLFQVQLFFDRIQRGVRQASDKLVEPSLRLGSLGAAWKSLKGIVLRSQK